MTLLRQKSVVAQRFKGSLDHATAFPVSDESYASLVAEVIQNKMVSKLKQDLQSI